MKRFPPTLLFTFFLFANLKYVNAQIQSNPDSVLSIRVRRFAKAFSLTETQQSDFFKLEKSQASVMDSIAHLKLSIDEESLFITSQLKKYDRGLKKILTDQQWKDYLAFIEKRREEFIKNASDKKVKVSEIKRDSL